MSKVPDAYRDDLRAAVDVLRRGGVILYPTDTVWGLGCDARNSEAVRRIYAIKHRADSKALITLVDSLAMLDRTVEEVPEVAEQLIEAAVDSGHYSIRLPAAEWRPSCLPTTAALG